MAPAATLHDKTTSAAESAASTAASLAPTASVDTDLGDAVLIVGAGLAGFVAAHELTQAGKKVVFVEQEPYDAGQAWWSLGGIFLIDSPEQRRVGIKDSYELARRDWFNSAQFDRPETEDKWAIKWAEEYLRFASGPMREYLSKLGLSFMPNVGWAERGSGAANGHGNSVPRFHLTWGVGPETIRIFRDPVLRAQKKGLVEFKFRHQVDEIVYDASGSKVVGVKGTLLEPSDVDRGYESSRKPAGTFTLKGKAVILATGGIGGNPDLVREMWPTKTLGKCPQNFVLGVPKHVDGRMLKIAQKAGANTVNADRFWFYTEGLKNWNSIWPNHGIRIIPGPSSMWLDATGKRFPAPLFPGGDTIATFKQILASGYDYSWFILDQTIVSKEFALSGSEQNPDLADKSYWGVLQRIIWGPEPVKNFMRYGEDFIVKDNLRDLVDGMNELATKSGRGPKTPIKYEDLEKTVTERDEQFDHPYGKDAQRMLVTNARQYSVDKLTKRAVPPHRLLDPKHGPLIAVRLNLLTRKTLGGVQTNLDSQALKSDGETPIPGLYAAGELAGFGGGGVHGYNALEGTFLTGCIFSGRAAGIAAARDP